MFLADDQRDVDLSVFGRIGQRGISLDAHLDDDAWIEPDEARPEEYREASLSTSVHFGRYSVDPVRHTITFKIDRSSVPNQDDTTAVRPYELRGDELSWRVAPRQDSSVPITTLRRVK